MVTKKEEDKIKLKFKYRLINALIIGSISCVISFCVWYHFDALDRVKSNTIKITIDESQSKDLKEIKADQKIIKADQKIIKKDIAALAGDIQMIKIVVKKDEKGVNAAEDFLEKNRGKKVVKNLAENNK